jgi:hypothetical protein
MVLIDSRSCLYQSFSVSNSNVTLTVLTPHVLRMRSNLHDDFDDYDYFGSSMSLDLDTDHLNRFSDPYSIIATLRWINDSC